MSSRPYSKVSSSGLRNQAGFTLVGVIVATMVIVVGILATVSVANVSVRASGDNERKVVGTNLAREESGAGTEHPR
ncbi:MAG: prepilin-type N-terminal cleavage/methylation domain-containing protein [Hymenobacter sp.]